MFPTAANEIYEDGDIIFSEGNHGDWIYVIESGAVELSKSIDGKKVVIEILYPDDVFGELGFIGKKPRTATARAIGKTTLGVLDKEYLDYEFDKLSSSFQLIVKSLAFRLEKTTRIAAQSMLPRQEPRFSKVFSLTYNESEKFLRAYSKNISTNGVFIATAKPLPKGSSFFLELWLPDDPVPVKAECTVCWSNSNPEKGNVGMGVKFIRIDKENKERILKVVGLDEEKAKDIF